MFKRKKRYFTEAIIKGVKASLYWDGKKSQQLYVELSVRDGYEFKPIGSFKFLQIKDVQSCLHECEKLVQAAIRGE